MLLINNTRTENKQDFLQKLQQEIEKKNQIRLIFSGCNKRQTELSIKMAICLLNHASWIVFGK